MNSRQALRFGVALMAAFWLAAPLARAGLIGSKAEDAPGSRPADLARVHEALATKEVADALAARGLPPEEVQRRVAQLSAEDLRSLASNLDQIQAAGEVPKYIWILLAILLALTSLAIIL